MSRATGQWIRQERAKRSMLRTELSKATGIPYGRLSTLENGGEPTMEECQQIDKAFEICLEEGDET